MLGIHPHVLHVTQQTALMSEDGLAHRARPHPEACAKLTGLRMAGQVFPKTTLVDVVFSAHWTRVVGGPSLRGNAGGIRILMGVLHVLHESFATEEEFVADGTAGCVRAADQGGVLLEHNTLLQLMTDLRRVGTKAGFCGEAFAADVAMERPVLRPFHLSVVISKVLLQIR